MEKIAVYTKQHPNFQDQVEPWVAIENVHSFNLQLSKFKDRNISWREVADQKLNKVKINRIFKHCMNEKKALEMFNKFSNRRSLKIFSNVVKMQLDVEFHQEIDSAINLIYDEIEVVKLIEKLPILLKKLTKIDRYYKTYISSLVASLDKNGDKFITPFELASLITEMFRVFNFQPDITTNEIENQIRELFSLSEILELGTLNWRTENSENPDFSRFLVKFNVITKEWEFWKRINGIDWPIEADFVAPMLKRSMILFPK